MTKRSRRGESSGWLVRPLCKMQTSCPEPAMSLPPMLMELMRLEPLSGMAHLSPPVSTRMDLPLIVDAESAHGGWGAPGESVMGPWKSLGSTVAKPVHLIEPSGQ